MSTLNGLKFSKELRSTNYDFLAGAATQTQLQDGKEENLSHKVPPCSCIFYLNKRYE